MALLMQLFISVGLLAVPLFATQLGATTFELGVIGMLGGAAYAFTVVAAGTLSDKLGRKRVIIGGTLFTGLVYILMPMSRAPAHLFLLSALSGCAMAFFWPVLEAWMSEVGSADEVGRGLGGFNVSWSAGGCVGPFIGGVLYTKSSVLAFLFAAAGTVVVACLAYLHKRPAPLPTAHSRETHAFETDAPIRVDRRLLYAVWASNCASWFAIAELRVLFPKLALVDLEMQPWMIGMLLFMLGLVLTVMFYIMGVWKRWHSTTLPLLYAQILVIALLLIMVIADSPVVLGIVFAGLGAGFGITYSYSLYFSIVGSIEKGAASGRHEMVLGVGGLLGPFLGGAAAELFHWQRAPYVLGALLILTSVAFQEFMLTRKDGVRSSQFTLGPPPSVK